MLFTIVSITFKCQGIGIALKATKKRVSKRKDLKTCLHRQKKRHRHEEERRDSQ